MKTKLMALEALKESLEWLDCAHANGAGIDSLLLNLNAAIAALEADITPGLDDKNIANRLDRWFVEGLHAADLALCPYGEDTISRKWWMRGCNHGILLAREPAAPAWIPVSEMLPEVKQPVALINIEQWENTGGDLERNCQAAGYLNKWSDDNPYWSIRGEPASCLEAYTHWMALPDAPGAES